MLASYLASRAEPTRITDAAERANAAGCELDRYRFDVRRKGILWHIDLGYCLEPDEYAQLLEDPPTHPETFASRVMGVQDGWSDPDAFIDVLLPVLKTFLDVVRANG